MSDRTFYAYIEVREWGEEPREQRIGPFTAEDPDATVDEQIDTLRDNLIRNGDDVNRIEVVEVSAR